MNTQWHRRRRALLEHPAQQGADASLLTPILMLVAGALLTVTSGLWVMLQLEQFGPSVGGIIVFKPAVTATDRWSVRVSTIEPAHVVLPAATGTRTCSLSPSMMGARGGSLVIEARRLSRPPLYRVHWSGGPTDEPAMDCGTNADLLLTRTELMRLANVAGGFNGGIRLIGP